jgi:hypothetical protein
LIKEKRGKRIASDWKMVCSFVPSYLNRERKVGMRTHVINKEIVIFGTLLRTLLGILFRALGESVY